MPSSLAPCRVHLKPRQPDIGSQLRQPGPDAADENGCKARNDNASRLPALADGRLYPLVPLIDSAGGTCCQGSRRPLQVTPVTLR